MTVNQAKYRRKDHLALTLPVYCHPPAMANFFDSEVITLSKYEPLWRFLSGDGSGCIQFSFERIEEILGFPLDHSFLNYKQEAEQFGYRVEKISLKEKWVRFVRIAAQWHHTFANPLAFVKKGWVHTWKRIMNPFTAWSLPAIRSEHPSGFWTNAVLHWSHRDAPLITAKNM